MYTYGSNVISILAVDFYRQRSLLFCKLSLSLGHTTVHADTAYRFPSLWLLIPYIIYMYVIDAYVHNYEMYS
jgi:hypothetical protein